MYKNGRETGKVEEDINDRRKNTRKQGVKEDADIKHKDKHLGDNINKSTKTGKA